MPNRKSSEKKPEYWDMGDPAAREAHVREIEQALESETPIQATEPLPPFDELANWWDNLPDEMQRKFAARAEDFSSLAAFFYSYLGKGVDFGPFGDTAREWINKNLDGLFVDAKKMRTDPAYARERIKRFLRDAKGYLDIAFRVGEAHRPAENIDRDRHWSKLNYQGLTYPKIADKHCNETGESLSDTAIRTVVQRHRKRRTRLTQFIAHAIWSREYGNT